MKRLFCILLIILFPVIIFCQKKTAIISGKVTDENDRPLFHVSVSIIGRSTGTLTNDSGKFTLKVPAERPFALEFSYTGYKTQQRNFNMLEGEKEDITFQLQTRKNELQNVTVTDNRSRTEAGHFGVYKT